MARELYAHVSKLIDLLVVIGEPNTHLTTQNVGVIVGCWTSTKGTPEVLVVRDSGRVERHELDKITLPDSTQRITTALARLSSLRPTAAKSITAGRRRTSTVDFD